MKGDDLDDFYTRAFRRGEAQARIEEARKCEKLRARLAVATEILREWGEPIDLRKPETFREWKAAWHQRAYAFLADAQKEKKS